MDELVKKRDSKESKRINKDRERYSLDDIATRLVQLEPSDLPEIVDIWEALRNISKGSSSSIQKLIDQAIDKFEEIIEDRADNPCATISDIGCLLEEAMYEAEEESRKDAEERREKSLRESENKEAQSLSPNADIDLIGDFIAESRDLIEGAEAALLILEMDPDDTRAISTVFRAFHTIKGTSSFLGLKHISELAHSMETVLSHMRDGEICCTGGYADLSLHSIDLLKELLQVVQDALEGEPLKKPEDYDDLLCILSDPEANGISQEQHGKNEAIRTQKHMKARGARLDSSVRVYTDRLDRLVESVGELVIAQSMVAQDEAVTGSGNHGLFKKVTHCEKIVRELQDLTMSMRMVPLGPTFQKMARVVRDLARKSGKKVNFTTEGEDTEIDRNMVDIISDPLMHLARNAVDHGIEAPDVREKKKKSKEGTVHFLAYHSAGSVIVEIKDDGKGLDKERIIEKAVSGGLIESDEGLLENEIYRLMFRLGFSTAEQVTEVSGRGVGLDVVEKAIRDLRGHIEVSSEPEQGTTFSLRLPLTLAITDGMLVKVGKERYIIPTTNIQLSFRPAKDDLFTVAGKGEMVMFRGTLLPLYRLHSLFDVKGAIEDPTESLLIVMSDGERCFALLVDELLCQQQVVAKSLGNGIGKVQGVFGGAILGDGNVGLILDPPGISVLAQQAGRTADRESGMVYI